MRRGLSKRFLHTDKSSSYECSSGDVFQILFAEKLANKYFMSIGPIASKADMKPFPAEAMFDENGRHCRTHNKSVNGFGSRFGEVRF